MVIKYPGRHVRKTVALVIMILFVSSFSPAQEVKTITNVDQAINLAYANNSSIIEAKLDKLKADEKVSEVYSDNLLPTVTLASRFQRAIRKQVFDIFGERFEVGSDNTFSNLIDLRESLPVLGTPVFTAIRIADYYSKSQEQNITSTEIDVRKKVKDAYYSVLLAKSIVEVNRLTQKNSEDNFNVVEKRYRIRNCDGI